MVLHGSRFPRQIQSRSPRRSTVWSAGPNSEAQTISAVVKVLWTNGSILATEPRTTIVRIRGHLRLVAQSFSVSTALMRGAFGIGIVSSDAFAAGIASMPGPHSDSSWPGWIWHQFWSIQAGVDAAIPGDEKIVDLEIDSKAMRKQGENETLFGMSEVVAESGAVSAILIAETRILDKLF